VSVAGPYAGRLAGRRGPVLPATAGLAIQVVSLAIYAQLSNTTGLWVVVLASIINGVGASFFAARRAGRRVHGRPARRVLRHDGVHGAGRRAVRPACWLRAPCLTG